MAEERKIGFSGILLPTIIAAGLAVLVVLAIASAYFQSERAAVDELASIALEDVSRRVERGVSDLRSVRAMSDAGALARARCLAQLIAENPKVLESSNRGLFDSYVQVLGVDELHVTDADGRLVRCYPPIYEGQDMRASAQSAAFMPAITNKAFELAQDPQWKGLSIGDERLDRRLFQYAGVARRDAPGIVQIGYRAERIAEAMKLADVSEIASNTRIGRDGRVRIEKLAPASAPADGTRLERGKDGRPHAVYEADCEGYRISVRIPVRATRLAEQATRDALLVLIFVLLLLLVVSFPAVRRTIVEDFRELRRQLRLKTDGTGAFLRVVLSPLALVSIVVFAAVLVIIWVVSSRTALQLAKERLRAAAEDMVEEIDSCVDAQLAFIGRELCDRYGSPEAMKDLDLTELARDYFVDELNVVDASGTCIATTVADIRGQNQWTLVNPAKFCRALIKDGAEVFSQPFRQSATEQTVFRKYVGVAFTGSSRGYIQLGFDRTRLQESIDYRLKDIAHNWHIGEHGFYVLSKTKNGVILSTQHEAYDGETLAGLGFDVFKARTEQNVDRRDPVSQTFLGFESVRYFVSGFAGEECLCTSGVVNQFHRYVAAIPISEVYGSSRRIVAVTASVLFAALLLVVFFMTKLSNLVVSLQEKERIERERQLKDLTLAKTIQFSALPFAFPHERDYSIYAKMVTAREVGGDFYDFCELPSGRILFLVADVSGKGVPAALFMMRAKAILRTAVAEHADDLSSAIAVANDALADHNEAEMFVTAWIGVYDRSTGDVAFVNAGHNPPLVRRADGTVEWVRSRSGIVLAAMGGMTYRVCRLHLAPGDSLFLYTDGVTEATNATGELYGEPRLERALAASDNQFVDFIDRDVVRFVAGAEQADDITMMAFDVLKDHNVN